MTARAVVYDGNHVHVTRGLTKNRTRTRETFRLRFFQNGPLGKGTGIEVELAQIDALAAELVNAASAIRASRKATSKMALAVK